MPSELTALNITPQGALLRWNPPLSSVDNYVLTLTHNQGKLAASHLLKTKIRLIVCSLMFWFLQLQKWTMNSSADNICFKSPLYCSSWSPKTYMDFLNLASLFWITFLHETMLLIPMCVLCFTKDGAMKNTLQIRTSTQTCIQRQLLYSLSRITLWTAVTSACGVRLQYNEQICFGSFRCIMWRYDRYHQGFFH